MGKNLGVHLVITGMTETFGTIATDFQALDHQGLKI